jgi:hypothetical protein
VHSGIAIGDVLNLKYSDFLKSLKINPKDFNKMLDVELLNNSWDENIIQEWYVRRQKTGIYIIHLIPLKPLNISLCIWSKTLQKILMIFFLGEILARK